MKVLVTGTAGFIGSFTAMRLLERGDEVVGIDNVNDYYDVTLKYARLERAGIDTSRAKDGKWVQSQKYPGYRFKRMALEDLPTLEQIFAEEHLDAVCHLAAQAGVRHSLTNPHSYIDSNIVGFLNLLECRRHHGAGHLVFASSSSVYGLNKKYPFSTRDNVDHPVSLYAATKKSNELMAHSYSHLFSIPVTGLRFFTVYGPWGRPDMALFLFTKAILEDRPIEVFNRGNMRRDFTYVDDIVRGTVAALDHPPQANGGAPHRIYNIGHNKPERLGTFIDILEEVLGVKAVREYEPMQPGDVPRTYADIGAIERDLGFRPQVSLREGLTRFAEWYRGYLKI